MKQILEFDETQQSPEMTLGQLKLTIDAFILTTGIKSLKVHEIRRTKSRTLAEAFLTWGEGELTDEQMETLTAILHSQPGLVGYTPPIPDPASMVGGCDPTAGLVIGAALPVTSGNDTYQVLVLAANTDPYNNPPGEMRLGYVANVGAGNVFTPFDEGIPAADMPATMLRLWIEGVATTMTILKTTPITLKTAGGTSLVLLPRQADIVMTGSNVYVDAWVDVAGKLYLKERWDDTVLADVLPRNYMEAVDFGPM